MANTAFTNADYTLLKEQTAYHGFFSLQKLQLKHRLFVGGWTQPISRELFVRGQANEQPEEVARRETQEEAGLEIIHLEHLYTYYASPGGSDEQVLLYLGIVDSSQVKTGDICGLATENEDLRVHVLSRTAALEETKNGQATNVLSIIALQWLALNHLQLKADWLKRKPK